MTHARTDVRFLLALASFGVACATGGAATRPAVGDSDVPPFRQEQRAEVYRLADAAAWTLWHSPSRAVSEHEVTQDGKTTRLVLECRDGDGKAEGWAFLPPGEESGPDFGFLFDLDRDGRVDYLVFNGGPMFDKTLGSLAWMNYHWIDSNADGRVDIAVYNDVDLDGDHFLDAGWTAWVQDRDLDGLPDAAEYVGPGTSRPVEKSDGCFVVKRVVGDVKACDSDRDHFGGLSVVMAHIQSAMR